MIQTHVVQGSAAAVEGFLVTKFFTPLKSFDYHSLPGKEAGRRWLCPFHSPKG